MHGRHCHLKEYLSFINKTNSSFTHRQGSSAPPARKVRPTPCPAHGTFPVRRPSRGCRGLHESTSVRRTDARPADRAWACNAHCIVWIFLLCRRAGTQGDCTHTWGQLVNDVRLRPRNLTFSFACFNQFTLHYRKYLWRTKNLVIAWNYQFDSWLNVILKCLLVQLSYMAVTSTEKDESFPNFFIKHFI